MNDKNNKRSRTLKTQILLLAGVFVVGVIVAVKLTAQPYYYRDSTRSAPSGAYDMIMDPALSSFADVELLPRLESVLNNTTIDDANEHQIVVTMPHFSTSSFFDNSQLDFHPVNQGESFEFNGTRVSIESIAVAYGAFPPDSTEESYLELPARIFDGELKELTSETFNETKPTLMSVSGRYPRAKFTMSAQPADDVRFLSYALFDATTHRLITPDLSWGENSFKEHEAASEILLWHATPVDFVVDVAFGPVQVFEVPAIPGETIKYPGGALMVLATAPWLRGSGYSMHQDSDTITLGKGARNPYGGATSLAYLALSATGQPALEVELLNDEGSPLQKITKGDTGSGNYRIVHTVAPMDEVKTVRVKYYPHRKRLTFRLSRIPGLPEMNRGIENLFAVRVPNLMIRNNYDFHALVENLTQLEAGQSWKGNDTIAYPIFLQDIPVKELVNHYARLRFGDSYRAKIYQENLTIEFLDMSPKARALRLWEAAKGSFR